jgi:hypothetical protein
MIDEMELRIGNWVARKSGTPTRIKSLYPSKGEYWFMGGLDELGELKYAEPISLTEEILIKAGFAKSDFSYDLQKLSIHLPSNFYKNGRTYFNSWCIKEGVPKSLHELQNLFFALTGEELKIEL